MDVADAQIVAFAAPPVLSIYFRFPRGHRQTCRRFDPVANDPKRTSASTSSVVTPVSAYQSIRLRRMMPYLSLEET
jgi:hypothetical protein